MVQHCWAVTSTRFARFRAGSSCVGSLCLEVTLVYTDKSQNHTCTQSPRLRAANKVIFYLRFYALRLATFCGASHPRVCLLIT